MSSTEEHQPPRTADVNEADIAYARIAPPRDDRDESDQHGDVLAGGDARKAPHSLSETERHPIEGASSGVSWDDPDEL